MGGLPEHVDFKELVEPFKAAKDEVERPDWSWVYLESLVFRQHSRTWTGRQDYR